MTSRIIPRTPAQLEQLRKAYLRKPLSHLRDLSGILNLPTEGKKAALVAAILTKCVDLAPELAKPFDFDTSLPR